MPDSAVLQGSAGGANRMPDFFYDALTGLGGAPPTAGTQRLMDEPAYEGVVRRMRRGGFSDNEIEQTLQDTQSRTAQQFGVDTQKATGPFEGIFESMAPQGNGPTILGPGAGRVPPTPSGNSIESILEEGLDAAREFLGSPTAGPETMPHGNPRIAPGGGGGTPDFLSAAFGPGAGAVGGPGQPSPHIGMPIPGAAGGPAAAAGPVAAQMFGAPGPRTAPQLPPGMPGPSSPAGPPPYSSPAQPQAGIPQAQAPDPSAMDKLLDYPGLMEFGLRLMAAGEGQAGAVRGPSFFGAVGQAGLGQLGSDAARAQRQAAAAFQREKFEEDKRQFGEKQATELRKIEADKDLRRATLLLKKKTEDRIAEIQRLRASTDAAQLETRKHQLSVDIDKSEREDFELLMDADPMAALDPKKRAEAERKARANANKLRKEAGIKERGPKDNPPGESQDEEKVKDGKRYRRVGDKVYPVLEP